MLLGTIVLAMLLKKVEKTGILLSSFLGETEDNDNKHLTNFNDAYTAMSSGCICVEL